MDKNELIKLLTAHKFAHRGLHDSESPENSLSAFKKAAEKGYGIELDVQQLASGEIVVFHDYTTIRVTGKFHEIKNLKKEDLGKIFLGKTKEMIPLFSDVLKLVNGKIPLLIEIKNEGKAGRLEQAVLNELENYKGIYLIQSFNPFSLKYIRKIKPEIPRGQLSGFFEGEKISRMKKFLLRNLLLNSQSKPDFISYEKDYLYMIKNSRLPTIAWVIKNKKEEQTAKGFNCSSIIFENFLP